jgi:hypothetical protein
MEILMRYTAQLLPHLAHLGEELLDFALLARPGRLQELRGDEPREDPEQPQSWGVGGRK